jgi:uncharacterized protein (TIGR03086 family)
MSPAGVPGQGMPLANAGTLERALRYALGAAGAVTPELMQQPTPCRGWDLRMLLLHAGESLAALGQGLDSGRVGLYPAAGGPDGAGDPALAFRERAATLLASCPAAEYGERTVMIVGCPMAAGMLALTGALEIAVHGWDISRACGSWEPIPPMLALDLLEVAPLLVAAADRYPLFAPPVPAGPTADPGDRLAAFLGREIVRPVQGGVIRCRTRQS